MWAEIEKHLPIFDSAVLNVADAEGYPYSVRCRAFSDKTAGVLRLSRIHGEGLRPGPASMLCHSHDEQTWNQKVFVLRGNLEERDQGWTFRPEKFVPSMGIGGALDVVRMVFGVRRNARTYLEKRGLPRPGIPWREIEAVKDRASRTR